MIMRVLKKIIFFVLLALVAVLAFILIWIHLPLAASDLKIQPEGHFAYVVFRLDKNQTELLEEISSFKFRDEYVIKSAINRFALKNLGSLLAPLKITALIDSGEDIDEFDYTLVIESAKLKRLLEIPLFFYIKTPAFKSQFSFGRQDNWQLINLKNNSGDISSYAFSVDTIIASTDLGYIEEIFKKSHSAGAGRKNPLPDGPVLVIVDDKKGISDYHIEKVKEEASYDIFSSVKELKGICLSLNRPVNKHEYNGSIIFSFKKETDFKKAKKDVGFLVQLIRRMMDANFYKLKSSCQVKGENITINFKMTKMRRKAI